MNDAEGHVDILVCMAGTGGTGFGTASYLRSRNPNLQVVLVQPHPDSRLTPEHPDAQIDPSADWIGISMESVTADTPEPL